VDNWDRPDDSVPGTTPPARHADTTAVWAGLPQASQSGPFLPGPVFAAPYHLIGDDLGAAAYTYHRRGNPTWGGYEQALGELEHGTALLFASGMAAIIAVQFTQLVAGGVLVVPADSYSLAREVAETYLRPHGVEVRTPPTTGPELRAAIPGATLVWLESLSNPGLDVCEFDELIGYAHDRGATVAIDNTLASPLGQRPLDIGADFTVASATKYLTGHSDLILGYVATTTTERAAPIHRWRTLTGAIAGPFEAWLAHRSLATFPLRFDRQCDNAARIADALAARPDVTAVRYPGRRPDPAHQLAVRHLSRFGGLLTFELESGEHARSFLRACTLIHEATSFGGVHTTAERTRRWSHDQVAEGFIRLSAGCEHPDDLIQDLYRALDHAARANRRPAGARDG
jgi:cystathionine gamma-lyase